MTPKDAQVLQAALRYVTGVVTSSGRKVETLLGKVADGSADYGEHEALTTELIRVSLAGELVRSKGALTIGMHRGEVLTEAQKEQAKDIYDELYDQMMLVATAATKETKGEN